MIEIPPRFAGKAPVRPESQRQKSLMAQEWKGAEGLAEDVRHYGKWMRDEAERRIGKLYPPIEVTAEMAKGRPDLKPYVGEKLTVIAWLWARTVKSPNPAFSHVDVPLVSTFMLSTKAGKEAYVEPLVERDGYEFTVQSGKPKFPERSQSGTTAGKRSAFKCLMSGAPVSYDHIRTEGKAGRMGARLMAIVAEGQRGRVYLPPTVEHELVARKASPIWKPDMQLPNNTRDFKTPNYGLTTYGDLFTPRQLVALTTFSDLVAEAMQRVQRDALAAGLSEDPTPLRDGGTASAAYAQALGLYLSFGVSKATDRNTSLCVWEQKMDRLRGTFGRQAIPMVWDFVETNPLAGAGGDIYGTIHSLCEVLDKFDSSIAGRAIQLDAQSQTVSIQKVISTDPPYYDNIGYADLSDFFYVWLRRSLRDVFPSVLATLAVPKSEELVATPYRHGGKEKAELFFLGGMTRAMHQLAQQGHPAFPITIYYAFKQSESDSEAGTTSTGWETFLEAVIRAGFSIGGTWPMRSELATRNIGRGNNALASSIVLVVRQRPEAATVASRREFARALSVEIPAALQDMTSGAEGWGCPIAPVDLSQSVIGPGMGIFTRYSHVLEADGSPMSVRTALQMINRFLADDDFDADTRFCLGWFEQFGFAAGAFGEADVLAKAKGTSVDGVKQAGVLSAGGGRVQLVKWTDYPSAWDPSTDSRIPVWEVVHHLIRALRKGGEVAAGRLLAQVQEKAGASRQLAYRLYTLSERAGRAEDARAYNELITGWPVIEAAMASSAPVSLPNPSLFDEPV